MAWKMIGRRATIIYLATMMVGAYAGGLLLDQVVSADSIIEQVVQKFTPANRPIPSEVTVKLQPEHLGNLQMKVSVEGDQVVTASPPFSGYVNSNGFLSAGAGGISARAGLSVGANTPSHPVCSFRMASLWGAGAAPTRSASRLLPGWTAR